MLQPKNRPVLPGHLYLSCMGDHTNPQCKAHQLYQSDMLRKPCVVFSIRTQQWAEWKRHGVLKASEGLIQEKRMNICDNLRMLG